MATIALPNNAILKRIVKGTTVAARDLAPVSAGATDTIEICELPEGAVVVDMGVVVNADLGNVIFGIKGPDIVDDPDFFLASTAASVETIVRANLRLGYEANTSGEIVTFDTSNGFGAIVSGRAWVLYTMDADVA